MTTFFAYVAIIYGSGILIGFAYGLGKSAGLDVGTWFVGRSGDRWAAFSDRETQDIHHALRMVCKHPMVGDDERMLFTELADEIWNRHAARVASNRDSDRGAAT